MADTPIKVNITYDDTSLKSAIVTARHKAAALNQAITAINAATSGRVWDPHSWHATSRPKEPRQPQLTPAAPSGSDDPDDSTNRTLAMYRDVIDKIARIHGRTHQCGGHWYTSDPTYRGNIAHREPCPTLRAVNAALIQDPRWGASS